MNRRPCRWSGGSAGARVALADAQVTAGLNECPRAEGRPVVGEQPFDRSMSADLVRTYPKLSSLAHLSPFPPPIVAAPAQSGQGPPT